MSKQYQTTRYIHDKAPTSASGRAFAGAETYQTAAEAAHKANRSRTGRIKVYQLVTTVTEVDPNEQENQS